ncbi:hypothetical protein BDP27DRAFT_1228142, partial [Rhodocollybia butyracea]
DPSFNVVTCLNGTGIRKSTILDAISFVLGLTNMSTVIAFDFSRFQIADTCDGVTKASVTIVFDNLDGERRRIAYES